MAACHDNDISEYKGQQELTAAVTFLRGRVPNGPDAELSSMCDISDRSTTHPQTHKNTFMDAHKMEILSHIILVLTSYCFATLSAALHLGTVFHSDTTVIL